MNELLTIKDLTVAVGEKLLVNQASFEVSQGKIVAIAGGSGSGKTTIGLSILNLLPAALRIARGQIIFEGQDLLRLNSQELRERRGARIGMVFQEPLSAFDPLFTIGQQIDEVLAAHTSMTKQERYQQTLEVLSQVELPDPKRAFQSYPHQLSGGMRQRAMIAQAIACSPSLIIADEPTSNLDVTLQVKINAIFKVLKTKNISTLLITHDLGMINQLADEVVILRQGNVVEKGSASQVIATPIDPYTRQLVEAFQ